MAVSRFDSGIKGIAEEGVVPSFLWSGTFWPAQPAGITKALQSETMIGRSIGTKFQKVWDDSRGVTKYGYPRRRVHCLPVKAGFVIMRALRIQEFTHVLSERHMACAYCFEFRRERPFTPTLPLNLPGKHGRDRLRWLPNGTESLPCH